MDDTSKAQEFEYHRARLVRHATRILGSANDADDVVQQAWFRFSRTTGDEIENPGAWLATVVGRLCIDALRARSRRAEDPLDLDRVDPVSGSTTDPERRALLADGVGLALRVILDTLSPEERVAFVLHDVFDVPFPEIASMLDRTPVAARKLASRARQRVRGGGAQADVRRAHHPLVDAFLAAARVGDLPALVAVLHPEIVLSTDGGRTAGGVRRLEGRDAVAGQLPVFHRMARSTSSRAVIVDNAPGLLNLAGSSAVSVIRFTFEAGTIIGIEIVSDPDRLGTLPIR